MWLLKRRVLNELEWALSSGKREEREARGPGLGSSRSGTHPTSIHSFSRSLLRTSCMPAWGKLVQILFCLILESVTTFGICITERRQRRRGLIHPGDQRDRGDAQSLGACELRAESSG